MLRKTLPRMVLWFLSLASVFLMFKSSDESMVYAIKHTPYASVFQQFPTGNTIVFSLSVGFLVSIFFYFLVVWIPERRRKLLLKHNFSNQYRILKRDLITVLLFASDGHYDTELPDKLLDQEYFREYFKQQISHGQNRWHAVANGLNERLLSDALIELELLMNETSFILNNVQIDDEDVLSFFKRLSQMVFRLKHSKHDHDDIKSLLRFLWDLLAGWSFIDGYRKNDIVDLMISKI